MNLRGKRTTHRSRNVVLAAKDVQKFSDLLAAAFPEARYYMEPTKRQTNYLYPQTGGPLRTRPPRVLIHHSLYRIWRAARLWDTDMWMILDPDWQPAWKRLQISDWHPCWSLQSVRHPIVMFQCRYNKVHPLRGATSMPVGLITAHCQPGNAAHLKFAGRFFRLLNKIASDRNLVRVHYPSGEIRETFIDKTAWHWVGHEARQWAGEDRNHFLAFALGNDTGLRPISSIDPPFNPPEA